jgi:hypothetical protein
MKKLVFMTMVIAASAVIITAFFMPWAKVATSVTGISKELTSTVGGTPFAGKVVGKIDKITGAIADLGDVEIKTTVRGNQVPALVNNQTSKVALSLAQVMFKSAEGIDKKSYLVYLLPLFGIICAVLAVLGLKSKIYVAAMLILGGIVSIGGLYNLYTMDIESQIVKISIENGLWYTMYAFLFIFLVGIVWFISDIKKA